MSKIFRGAAFVEIFLINQAVSLKWDVLQYVRV